jgi:hypothetical protein
MMRKAAARVQARGDGYDSNKQSLCVVNEWPARWEPQEEGMKSVAASFPSVKKPRFKIVQEKGDGDDWRWCLLVCDSSGQLALCPSFAC